VCSVIRYVVCVSAWEIIHSHSHSYKQTACVEGQRKDPTRELRLRGNVECQDKRISDEAVFPLFEALGHGFAVSPFTSIDLSYNMIRNYGAKAISVHVQQTQSLESLNLCGNEIGRMGCEIIAEHLQHNHSLLSVNLNTNPIGDVGLVKVADMLLVNNTLEALDIGHTDMKQNALVKIAIALRNNTSLRLLNVDSPLLNSLQEQTTIHFARALRENSTLESLSMAKHGIRDHGAKWLAEALKLNSTLQAVNLSCNRIGTSGVAALAEALLARATPCIINLSSCPLRGQELTEINDVVNRDNRDDVSTVTFQTDGHMGHFLESRPIQLGEGQ
jgi:Ran GTPase-activating protein (RanGAP) involved in mRNA processing and transport